MKRGGRVKVACPRARPAQLEWIERLLDGVLVSCTALALPLYDGQDEQPCVERSTLGVVHPDEGNVANQDTAIALLLFEVRGD